MDILFASGNHALTAKPWWLLLLSLTHKSGGLAFTLLVILSLWVCYRLTPQQ